MLFNGIVSDLQSLEGTYFLGDPWRLGEKGLTILVPIRCNAPPKRSYVLVSESKDNVNITDTGKIDELIVDNKSGSPVFIRGGTVFKGKSGQDRAVVQGTVVQPVQLPEKSVPIVVKCVHAHRSIVTGGGFSIMDDLAPQEIYASLQSRDQHRVWGAVADYSAKSAYRLRASSVGASFSASLVSDPDLAETLSVNSKVRTDFSKQIMDALSKVPDYDDQVGVVVITVDGVQGLELFDSPESWKALGKEVVKSFSEIFHQDESIADLFTLNMDAVKDKVRKFLKELDGVTYRMDDGTFTIDDETAVTCEYTNLDGQCIHMVVTKKTGRKYPKPQPGNPIVPDLYDNMFEHDNTYRPHVSPPRRYERHYPLMTESWINRDMDTTLVPPVKKASPPPLWPEGSTSTPTKATSPRPTRTDTPSGS